MTTLLLCLLSMPAAYPQVETPTTAEDSQQSDAPQLSLSDLDALMEEDSEDEDTAAVIGDQIFDLLVLSAFLSLALLSFFKKSTTLKYVTMIVSIVYIEKKKPFSTSVSPP